MSLIWHQVFLFSYMKCLVLAHKTREQMNVAEKRMKESR